MEQAIIKVVLILALVSFAFILIRASSSARSQAIRTLVLSAFLLAAIIAVIFPAVVNDIAQFLGVGRGTDLLLYAFILVVMAQALAAHRARRSQEEKITALARTIALSSPEYPERD